MKGKPILRIYDIVLSLIILIIFFIPVLLLIVIKLIRDGLPLFYNSKRIGIDGIPFTVYKFRTMVDDKDFISKYLGEIKSYGFEQIPQSAEIYTKMGRFFEKYQIVEILQIFNVLKGNMSIIGYRPLPKSRVDQLIESIGSDKMTLRHSVLPGITGFSQIIGKSKLTNEERVYIENGYNLLIKARPQKKVVLYNTLIILETIVQIVFRRDIFIKLLKHKILSEIPEKEID